MEKEKLLRTGRTDIEGSIRGPRGPKKLFVALICLLDCLCYIRKNETFQYNQREGYNSLTPAFDSLHNFRCKVCPTLKILLALSQTETMWDMWFCSSCEMSLESARLPTNNPGITCAMNIFQKILFSLLFIFLTIRRGIHFIRWLQVTSGNADTFCLLHNQRALHIHSTNSWQAWQKNMGGTFQVSHSITLSKYAI